MRIAKAFPPREVKFKLRRGERSELKTGLKSDMEVEEYRLHSGKRALAYTITSLMIGIMLNTVVTSHLTNINC